MNGFKRRFTGCFIRGVLLLLILVQAPFTAADERVTSRAGNCLTKRHAKWIESGIAHSRQGHPVLVVDKAAHTMDLYQKGKKTKTYPVELGMETQKEGGWRPTPLGTYDLKYKAYTKYYKALLYKMPGYYEIHGEGSGLGLDGSDWTFGCIALSNGDMDDLFVRIGIERNGFPVGPQARKRVLEDARLIIAPSGRNAQSCD